MAATLKLIPQDYNPVSVQLFLATAVADDGTTPVSTANGAMQVTVYSGTFGGTVVTGPTAMTWNAAKWPSQWSLEIAASLFPSGVQLYTLVQVLDLSANVLETQPFRGNPIY